MIYYNTLYNIANLIAKEHYRKVDLHQINQLNELNQHTNIIFNEKNTAKLYTIRKSAFNINKNNNTIDIILNHSKVQTTNINDHIQNAAIKDNIKNYIFQYDNKEIQFTAIQIKLEPQINKPNNTIYNIKIKHIHKNQFDQVEHITIINNHKENKIISIDNKLNGEFDSVKTNTHIIKYYHTIDLWMKKYLVFDHLMNPIHITQIKNKYDDNDTFFKYNLINLNNWNYKPLTPILRRFKVLFKNVCYGKMNLPINKEILVENNAYEAITDNLKKS